LTTRRVPTKGFKRTIGRSSSFSKHRGARLIPFCSPQGLADLALELGFRAVSGKSAVFLRGRGDFLYRRGKLQSRSCRLT
jgi:hypothetical protein